MNKKWNLLLLGIIPLAMLAACHRSDIQTIVIDVPTMTTSNCSVLVHNSFVKSPPLDGILSLDADPKTHSVTITYDSREIAIKNLVYIITDAGFEANGNPPNKEAQSRLPISCR